MYINCGRFEVCCVYLPHAALCLIACTERKNESRIENILVTCVDCKMLHLHKITTTLRHRHTENYVQVVWRAIASRILCNNFAASCGIQLTIAAWLCNTLATVALLRMAVCHTHTQARCCNSESALWQLMVATCAGFRQRRKR